MDWSDFGKRVRTRREELNISQQEIAVALGIDQAKVSLIERGARKVDLVKEMPALIKVLRSSMSALVQDEATRTADEDPVSQLLAQYFPGVQFEDFEKKRIAQFLELATRAHVKTTPDLEKKVSNG